MRLIVIILSLLIETSAFAGVSSPHATYNSDSRTNETYIDIIRIIGGKNDDDSIKKSAAPHRKTHKTNQRGQIILFPGDTIPDEFTHTPNNTFGALDFLSTVYEDNDYYETGFWGEPDIPIEKAIYSGPLPQCGLENFIAPVKGRITSHFGYREEFGRFHKGIDIHLCIGDTVCVALPGKVVRIGYERGGYGHFIIVSHSNGIETRYAHLQRPLVKTDDILLAGQPIALGGSSGNSTGPHLHFEIRYMGRAIDPQRVYD